MYIICPYIICACVFVCIYVRMCACMHMYVRVCTCLSVKVCIFSHTTHIHVAFNMVSLRFILLGSMSGSTGSSELFVFFYVIIACHDVLPLPLPSWKSTG